MEVNHLINICVILYLLWKYSNYLFDEKKIVPFNNPVTPEKEIQYFVNNREIEEPITEYYLKILDIYNDMPVNSNKVRKAYREKIHFAMINDNEFPDDDIADLKAARAFLLDQREYMVMVN